MSDYSELKRLAERYDIPDDVIGQLELLMIRKLKAENEALRKDAERYRWLAVDTQKFSQKFIVLDCESSNYIEAMGNLSGDFLSARIDEEMEKSK